MVLGIGITLRFSQIAAQSLWLDEGLTLEFARKASIEYVLRTISDCRSTECLSPLYPLLLHGAIGWLGEAVAVLRGFSALCGVGTVVALICTARAMFSKGTAILVGALVSISAFAVWYSQDARAYSLSLLFVSTELYGVAVCLESKTERAHWQHQALLALSVALGILSNILFTISTIALCAAHLTATRELRRWRTTWWPSAIAGSLPILYFVAAKAASEVRAAEVVTPLAQNGFMNLVYAMYGLAVGITFGPPQAALRGADKWEVLREHVPALSCAGALALLLAIVVATARRSATSTRRQRLNAEVILQSLGIGIMLAIMVGVATGINWQPRHSFFLFPPAVLLAAFSAHALIVAGVRWQRTAASMTIVLFCVTNLWSLHNYFKDAKYGKDDYRGAAEYLIAESKLGHRTVLVSGSPLLLQYYGDTTTVDLTGAENGELLEHLWELSQPEGKVLVAMNREFSWRGGAGLASVVEPSFAVRKLKQLQYFDIYVLTARKNHTGESVRDRSGSPIESVALPYSGTRGSAAAAFASSSCRAHTQPTPCFRGTDGYRPRSVS